MGGVTEGHYSCNCYWLLTPQKYLLIPIIDHVVKMAANTEAKATEIKTPREISIKPGLSFSTFEELNVMVNQLMSNRCVFIKLVWLVCACVRACMYVCARVCMCVHVSMYVCACAYVLAWILICGSSITVGGFHVYMCVHDCVCELMSIYVCPSTLVNVECYHGDIVLSRDFPKILLDEWLSSRCTIRMYIRIATVIYLSSCTFSNYNGSWYGVEYQTQVQSFSNNYITMYL